MSKAATFTDDSGTLRFTGNLALADLGDLPERLDATSGARAIDLSGVDRLDTVGAWVIHRYAARHDLPVEGLSDDRQHLLSQVERADAPIAAPAHRPTAFLRVLGEIGEATTTAGRTLVGLLGFFGKVSYKWFLGWFILMSVLGALGMYDFNLWLVDYGTDLDPKAIMAYTQPDGSPMSYKPPLIGYQKMLNFDVDSWPATGAYMIFVGMLLTVIAFFVGKNASKKVV